MDNSRLDRHLEISSKLIEIGNSLIREGKDNSDESLAQLGTLVIFVGSLILDDRDLPIFGYLCSMFTSKKILETLESDSKIGGVLKTKSNENTYNDFIKKINDLRKGGGFIPLA